MVARYLDGWLRALVDAVGECIGECYLFTPQLQQRSVFRQLFYVIDHEGVNLGILLNQLQANLLFQGAG